MRDRIAGFFGIEADDRAKAVAAMLATGRAAAGGYWLQLATATVIAILGLALGSTASVIGAMLVSPLMTPIVQLGMGLAVGSPLLVIRSSMRVVASCVAVVLGAAAVVVVLPFSEMTSEISARTSPTVLDLAIASACAVAGLYAAIRPGSETASTAAGTAIGIALVPPLCVVGYGLGTTTWHVAGGAALLFTANFCAIVLFSVVGFIVFGFASVDVPALERAHSEGFEPTRLSGRVARRLALFFASRAARVVRVVMPLALVIVVFVPLRNALGEVAWEIRVRSAIQDAMKGIAAETVHSTIRIDHDEIEVHVVAIGDGEVAHRIRTALRDRIAQVAPAHPPIIDVATVPDARALARAEAALRDRPGTPAAAPSVTLHADITEVRDELERALTAWPADACGPLLSWNVSFPVDGTVVVTTVHLGAALGAPASDVLARAIERDVGGKARITDVALSPEPIAKDLDAGGWLAAAVRELARADAIAPNASSLVACVQVPRDAAASDVERAARELAVHPRASIESRDGDGWSFRWSSTPCASDAGASDAGATD